MALGLGQMLIGGLIGSQMFGGKEKEPQPQMKGGWSPPNQQQPTQVASNNTNQSGGGFISGISNSMFKGMSQEQVARLGMGFNSMRLRPDQGMHDAFQNTVKNAQNKINTNATVIELRKMGKPNLARMVEIGAMPVDTALTLAFKEGKGSTDIKSMIAWLTGEASTQGREHFKEYAEILTSNPSMLDDISKNVMNDLGFGDTNLAIKTSAPNVMQEGDKAGHEYVVVTDPNKKPGEQVSIEYTGAILPTKMEEIEAKAQQEFIEADQTRVQEVARDAFQQGQALESDVYDYKIALDTLVYYDENGVRKLREEDRAKTGWLVTKFLPAMDTNTALLRRVANVMGIKVINMATFGALSEREMAMAMATNLDLMLPQQELVAYIDEMIEAKLKLARVMYDRVNEITYNPEMTYTQWMKDTTAKFVDHNNHRYHKLNKTQQKDLDDIVAEGNYPEGYTGRMLWNTFNLDQRKGFM